MRPSGTPRTIASRIFWPASPLPTKASIAGVSVGPGQTVLTVTPARHLARECLGERDRRALAARVDDLARRADAPGVGRDVDDAPALARVHALADRVRHVQRPH